MATGIISFSAELAQQLMESADGFPVDFELAWVWLGYATKASAKRSLKCFKLGRDFNKVVEKSTGRDVERFWLTVDCFKSMGMMAQTDQGDQVREYFLDCERKAKIAHAPMSMAELAVYSAQKLLEHESRIALVEQQNALLVEQNQYLNTQVTLLQSSQEALELETDANAAELNRYRNGHGRYYTVAAWCNLHGHMMSLQSMNTQGRKASAICRIQNIVPQPVSDPRWGTVQSYPDTILMEMNWD
jgi:hypothetical protein